MTSMGYEARLEAFAQGKRLRRFRGMIRNPKDPGCDACGSVMPSHLFGLRNMETGRDYFLGQSCLAFLTRMLVIERPFVRSDIKAAFEKTRGEGTDSKRAAVEPRSAVVPHSGPVTVNSLNGNRGNAEIQIHEGDDFVTVLVRMVSTCGRHQAWGAASEPRYREVWRPDEGLVLRPIQEPNKEAVAISLTRAREDALKQLEAKSGEASKG